MNAWGCRLQIKILTPLSLPIPSCVEQEISMYKDSKEPRNIYYKTALKQYTPEVPYIFKQNYFFSENSSCYLCFQDIR